MKRGALGLVLPARRLRRWERLGSEGGQLRVEGEPTASTSWQILRTSNAAVQSLPTGVHCAVVLALAAGEAPTDRVVHGLASG